MNGLGYPHGLQGENIPIESRIIAVADIFDALTSKRPYKEAWSNERAFAMLQEMSGLTLDPDCVNAILNNVDRIEEIQARFAENVYG
jgi:HD-GYP domain-containing protein (c-di-GMP phosphodiesterase class II)